VAVVPTAAVMKHIKAKVSVTSYKDP